jgi:hypothetical protein
MPRNTSMGGSHPGVAASPSSGISARRTACRFGSQAVKLLIALAVLDAAKAENRYVDRWLSPLADDHPGATTTRQPGLGPRRWWPWPRRLHGIGVSGIRPAMAFWGNEHASANSLAIVMVRARSASYNSIVRSSQPLENVTAEMGSVPGPKVMGHRLSRRSQEWWYPATPAGVNSATCR